MDAKTMERLLIDKRLGELPPDTERLLEAYVQLTPSADTVMSEIDNTLNLAARALRPQPSITPETLPPLSLADALHRGRSQGRTGWARPLALAAAIVLAFLLGTRMTQDPSATPSNRTNGVAQSTPFAPSTGAEFWSVAKYVSNQAAAPAPGSDRLEWTSPLTWPQHGERL